MKNITNQLIEFLEKSPTQFQAIDTISSLLRTNNFTRIKESDSWKLSKGKYFVTRNNSSLIAFEIPEKLDNYHFNIASSHCDSPTFKIKDISEIEGPKGYLKLNVEMYGGAILYTWFDKPLSVAGRVLVKQKSKTISKNIYIDSDLLIIPSMPPHIMKDINKGVEFNIQIDLCPLVSSDVLHKGDFKKIIASECGCKAEDIVSYDLYLVNRQKPTILGYKDEFVCAPKLDDLQAAYLSLQGFIDSKKNDCIKVYACFDSEEVGSLTRQGASSTFLYDTLMRINNSLNRTNEDFYNAIAKSFNVSFDNAHALHPNHSEKYDQNNQCLMNKGIVIKENASQSYTTDAFSRAIFKQICENAKVPTQSFANRSDSRGGSTLGNISNNQVSLCSVDIGLAQLAMHSSYETAGCKDNEYAYLALKQYYSSKILINETESFEIK